MSLFLLAVFAPVIVSPLLFILSAKGRKIVMSIYIIGLLYLAFSLLSNPGLGSYTFFSTSLFQLESKLTLLSFSEHPYSIIAAFGFYSLALSACFMVWMFPRQANRLLLWGQLPVL